MISMISVNDELERMWPILRYYHSIYLEDPRKGTKILV